MRCVRRMCGYSGGGARQLSRAADPDPEAVDRWRGSCVRRENEADRSSKPGRHRVVAARAPNRLRPKKDETVPVTGAAGFIGFHVAQRLLSSGRRQCRSRQRQRLLRSGVEKEARLDILKSQSGTTFVKSDPRGSRGHEVAVRAASLSHRHSSRGPGRCARYSLENPHAYTDANIEGFLNVLEGCRHHGCEHLLFASSSSVYGTNTKLPFSVRDNVDHPISLYAASKKANELMAHAYSHLYRIPATGLRFFTVYGPGGVLTWRCSSSQRRFRGSRSGCSTTATCGATLLMSTTSSKRSYD